MPRRLMNRTEVALFVHDHCRSSVVRKCVLYGQFELLGGFSKIPPSGRPGWCVRVRSRYGHREREWNFAVLADEAHGRVSLAAIDVVPWRYWDGRVDRPEFSIYDGDRPREYARLKMEDQIRVRRRTADDRPSGDEGGGDPSDDIQLGERREEGARRIPPPPPSRRRRGDRPAGRTKEASQ